MLRFYLIQTLEETLKTSTMMVNSETFEAHPKIQALETKMSMLEINRQLKANSLLPKLNVGYNYISEPSYFNSFNADDYKFNIDFSIPLMSELNSVLVLHYLLILPVHFRSINN